MQRGHIAHASAVLAAQGYELDTTSAGTIQESLKRLRQAGEDRLILDILQLIATKPMKVSSLPPPFSACCPLLRALLLA